mmetsp:Transcript_17167/g.53228  ORF Transcript_17167/g.53228 Transcript_17167/m.53228 type:complete len:217 (+) Transcript_17167:279-929(+)
MCTSSFSTPRRLRRRRRATRPARTRPAAAAARRWLRWAASSGQCERRPIVAPRRARRRSERWAPRARAPRRSFPARMAGCACGCRVPMLLASHRRRRGPAAVPIRSPQRTQRWRDRCPRSARGSQTGYGPPCLRQSSTSSSDETYDISNMHLYTGLHTPASTSQAVIPSHHAGASGRCALLGTTETRILSSYEVICAARCILATTRYQGTGRGSTW